MFYKIHDKSIITHLSKKLKNFKINNHPIYIERHNLNGLMNYTAYHTTCEPSYILTSSFNGQYCTIFIMDGVFYLIDQPNLSKIPRDSFLFGYYNKSENEFKILDILTYNRIILKLTLKQKKEYIDEILENIKKSDRDTLEFSRQKTYDIQNMDKNYGSYYFYNKFKTDKILKWSIEMENIIHLKAFKNIINEDYDFRFYIPKFKRYFTVHNQKIDGIKEEGIYDFLINSNRQFEYVGVSDKIRPSTGDDYNSCLNFIKDDIKLEEIFF